MEQIIAIAEHWMSRLRDEQLRRKMTIGLSMCNLALHAGIVLGFLAQRRRVLVALGFLCFEVHEANIQPFRLVLREDLTAQTPCPRSWWHLHTAL